MNENLAKVELVLSTLKKNEIIEILKEAYAKDLITIDEYEKRVELAERSKSIDDINQLTQDLPSNHILDEKISESESVHCEMATKQFNGSFLLTKKMIIEASMSTITLDYRTIKPTKGIQEIVLKTNMTTIILFLPNNVTTENRLSERMTTIKETSSNTDIDVEKVLCIRFLGDAEMTTIKIKRERRGSRLFGNKLKYK